MNGDKMDEAKPAKQASTDQKQQPQNGSGKEEAKPAGQDKKAQEAKSSGQPPDDLLEDMVQEALIERTRMGPESHRRPQLRPGRKRGRTSARQRCRGRRRGRGPGSPWPIGLVPRPEARSAGVACVAVLVR